MTYINGGAINGQAAVNGVTVVGSPPATPTSLTATPVSTSQINLAWTDNATNETGYKVYRSTNGGAYSLIDTIAANSQSYNDVTVTAGAIHSYKVAAYNGSGESESNAAATNTLLYGLTSYWALDESSAGAGAVTRNDSVGTNHLSDLNTTPSGTGKRNNGCDFESGSNEALDRADTATLRVTGSFTWAIWFNPESTPGSAHYLLGKGIATASWASMAYRLYRDGSSVLTWQVGNGVTNASVTKSGATASAWHLVIIWHDAENDQIGIQLDNGTVSTVAWANGVVDLATFPQKIACAPGNLGNAGATFDGIEDEIGFWNGRVLTSAERTALWGSGGAGLFYPFWS